MPFILSVDYDATLFEGTWPKKGKPIQAVIDKVKEFKSHGAEIALWTCREGVSLEEATKRCDEAGLEFDAINSNVPSQIEYMKERAKEGEIFATRKIYADFYLDDKAHNIEFFLKINVKETCKAYKNR